MATDALPSNSLPSNPPTSEQELKATMHQMLLDHTHEMHRIQKAGVDRFMRIANVQLRAIDRVLEDPQQRLGEEVARNV